MDQHHSTTLTRALSSTPCRRDFLHGLTAAVLRLSTLRQPDPAAAKNKHRQRRKNRKRKPQPPTSPPSSSPTPPGRTTRVDATCSGAELSGGGNRDGNFRIAQTFTTLTSGLLVTAELPIIKEAGSDGDYALRLSPLGAGVPTDVVLAETTVTNASVPSGGPEGAPVTFTFGTPASVVAGTQYALVLTRPGGGLLQWRGDLGNPCTGRSFFSPNQTEPFTLLSEGIDLNFTTFVSS
jgi:hypothetical protein